MAEPINPHDLLAQERRLRSAVEEDLRLRLRQQEAVAQLGEYALSQNLDNLFYKAVQLVADTLGMEFCKVLELLPEGDRLLLRAGVGWADGLVGRAMVGTDRDSQAGYTLLTGGPVIVDDLRAETRFSGPKLLTDHRIVSGMSVVIHGRGRPFGVLGVHSGRRRNFLPHDTRFMVAIASILASAVQRFAVEEDLKRSRNELAIILGGVNEGITVQDRTGKLVYVNQAAAEIMGFSSAEEAKTAPLSEIHRRFVLFDEQGQPMPFEKLPGRRVLQGEPRASARVRFRVMATGEERWSIIDASPIHDSAGNVIQTVNIFRDITEMALEERNQRFLAEAGELLTSSIDYKTTLINVAQLAVTNLADWCAIYLVNESQEAFQLTVAHKDPARLKLVAELQKRYPPNFNNASRGVGRVLKTGEAEYYPTIPEELLEQAAVDAEHLEKIRALGMRAGMTIPLTVHGRTLGAITLVWSESGRGYTQQDVGLVQELARRAALAIDNAQLYHAAQRSNVELERRVEERTRELMEANQRLMVEIEERRKTEHALQKSEVMLHSLFESAPDAVLLVRRDGNIVRANQQAEVMFGYSRAELIGSSIDLLLLPGLRREHARKRASYIQDMVTRSMGAGLELAARRKDGAELPVDIMLSPIQTDEGEMVICAVRNMTEQKRLQAELAETHRRLFEGVETERLRISQELHDGPIQELYGVALNVELLSDLIATLEQPAQFDEIKTGIQATIQTLRGICGDLRPPILAQFGLEKAIRSHLSKLREAHPELTIEADLASDGLTLPERTRLALYRVYQNAISNTIRHARATAIEVKFRIEDGQIELAVQDNGCGFKVPKKWVDLAREGHFGLVGMAERVEAIGGELIVESKVGQGTNLRVIVPLEQPLMSPQSL